MKKRGFTLIELLAVIVVLAIIALIATPIVMNLIKNAQKGAAERSAERYLDAVETAIAADRLENGLIADGEYVVNGDGNLERNGKLLIIEVNGDKPSAGSKIYIENGLVTSSQTNIILGDYTVKFKDGKAQAEVTAANNTITLLDICSLESGQPNTVGSMYKCDVSDTLTQMEFYVLEAGSSTKDISLIYAYNDDDAFTGLSWCKESENVSCEADGLTDALESIRDKFKRLDRSQVTLPTIEQIAAVAGHNLEEGTFTLSSDQKWLHGGDFSDTWGVSFNYWTSSVSPTPTDSFVWCVLADGSVVTREVGPTKTNDIGVRPVITFQYEG